MLRAVLRHGARTGISKLSSTAAPISPLLLPATGIVTWHYAERLRRDPSADRTAASLAQTASQIYSQVRIMQETLFRFPVYGSPESLMFEDALGRQHLLPLAYVHNWELFQQYLQAAFENLPGQKKIALGEYKISRWHLAQERIIAETWDRLTTPGSRIEMSMVFPSGDRDLQRCPSCHTTLNGIPEEAGHMTCHECGLTFQRIEDILRSAVEEVVDALSQYLAARRADPVWQAIGDFGSQAPTMVNSPELQAMDFEDEVLAEDLEID